MLDRSYTPGCNLVVYSVATIGGQAGFHHALHPSKNPALRGGGDGVQSTAISLHEEEGIEEDVQEGCVDDVGEAIHRDLDHDEGSSADTSPYRSEVGSLLHRGFLP